MANDILDLSGDFDAATEAQWREIARKSLKGRDPDSLDRAGGQSGVGGITIKALYRETDWPSAEDPLGYPGAAPFVRGGAAARDAFLPWDIRQTFTHPDPAITNAEILRDLERGVSSAEIKLDCTGANGCSICDLDALSSALSGVRADIATVALDHGGGTGTSAASLLGLWAEGQTEPGSQKLAFNMDPLGSLARLGLVEGGLDAAFARAAALSQALAERFPLSTSFRIDARMAHEAGGLAAEELAALIASAVDTLRRLDAAGLPPEQAAPRMIFCLAAGPVFKSEIAKLRAARRLWARCLDALGLEAAPMTIQSVTSARMLTRYDPWVNMLRNTAACFGAGVGGADIVTVRAFNEALGVPEELGRRTARNTQIIAQEESNLGKVADPAGGSWAIETLADQLSQEAWAMFQEIESEGGYGASLMADAFQARVAETRLRRRKAAAKRKAPMTGVSEFPTLDEVPAPTAEISWNGGADGVSDAGLAHYLPGFAPGPDEDAQAEPFWPIRVAEPFERLRDHAQAREAKTGARPSVFLATLGPLAEHTARADFARNVFAAGGIAPMEAPTPPKDADELALAFKASGSRLAVLCGSDDRYAEEAAAAAEALKAAGVVRLYLAGKPGDHEAAWTSAGVDSFIYMGCDVIGALELAHAELGLG
ncbi:MAG: methylmalonyl-CoA mutase family protein [Pseudomonadota bacterium]